MPKNRIKKIRKTKNRYWIFALLFLAGFSVGLIAYHLINSTSSPPRFSGGENLCVGLEYRCYSCYIQGVGYDTCPPCEETIIPGHCSRTGEPRWSDSECPFVQDESWGSIKNKWRIEEA